MAPGKDAEPLDTEALFQSIELAVIGQPRTMTRLEVSEASGVPEERASVLWRSLGFTSAGDEDVLFNESDVEALRLLTWLVDSGFTSAVLESTLARSMGRSFARLAEWEVSELAASLLVEGEPPDAEMVTEIATHLLPVIEDLQNYVWRRHLANAAGRLLLHPTGSADGVPMVVGFADIVGFTRASRRMSTIELARLVEHFEGTVSRVITEHHGRVIKTIGDEVLFVADEPAAGARIALDLAGGSDEDDEFPEVRVGVAYGDVLNRLGDVFGPVVNIASRLTSLSRPQRVLIDRNLARELNGDPEFRVRRGRRVSVKGYERLELWTLKYPSRTSTADQIGARLRLPPIPNELREVLGLEPSPEDPVEQ